MAASKWTKERRHVVIGYVALLLMNPIDCLYTAIALARGGNEGNPLMNFVLQHWGIEGIFVVKGSFLIIFAAFLHTIADSAFLRRFFYGAVGVYACLTAYHVLLYYGIVGPFVL